MKLIWLICVEKINQEMLKEMSSILGFHVSYLTILHECATLLKDKTQ